MCFQISGLDVDQFKHLFGEDPEALATSGVERIIVDNKPGYPCRVSLQDADIGETVLLMNYEHQPALPRTARVMQFSFENGRVRLNLVGMRYLRCYGIE